MDILEKFGIDPYEYLGIDVASSKNDIKKAYKTRAMILHPDKTGGKTEAEFKLLVLSYKYAIKNCVDNHTSTFEELKNTPRENKHYQRTFHNTNFEDTQTRNELFVDDDIDLDQFEEQMKRTQGLSTTYTAENFYKKEVLDTMKTNGKFDKLKFNAFFVKLQKDGKIQNQLTRREKVVACNANKEYVNVNVYDDMMVNSVDKSDENYKKFLKQSQLDNDDITELGNVDEKVLKKLINQNKKDTGRMSRKRILELQEKAKIDIPVNTSLSFGQGKKKMLLDQISDLHVSNKKQKEYVLKNKRIFANSIAY